MHDGTDPDATNLLEKGKLIAVPVVNADGYDLSRSLQNEQKRKNCRITAGVIPTLADCTLAANVNRGIDLNRNYLPFWGGPGSSTSATASNTRGEAPGSEPEIQGMIDLLNRATRRRSRSTTTRRTSACCARRARPTSRTSSPTRSPTRRLLQRLSKNLPGWAAGPWTDVYYEASTTAEQQAYYAYGAFGFTPEATPGFSGAQTFHPPYQNVIDNYLGTGTRYAEPDDARPLLRRVQGRHRSRSCTRCITGTAPAGAKLTLTKSYDARLQPHELDDAAQPARSAPAANALNATHHGAGEREVRVARQPVACAPSQYNATSPGRVLHARLHRAGRHRARDARRVKIARGELANRSLCTPGGVGGTVPATLALTLGTRHVRRRSPRAWRRTTTPPRTANVISTAGDANLSVADPSSTVAPASWSTARSRSPSRCGAGRPSPAGGAGSALAPVSAQPDSLC